MTKRQLSQILQHREIVAPAVIAGVCTLTSLLGETGRLALRYERTLLEAGQWWRILSAHFVHLSATHTALNIAGLVLVAALYRRELRLTDWTGTALAAACGIVAGLYLLDPGIDWYVGLSGLLHGWYLTGAVRVLCHEKTFGAVLLAALAAKLAWEQSIGVVPSTAMLEVGPVIVSAHLYGTCAAGLYCTAMLGRRLVARTQPRL